MAECTKVITPYGLRLTWVLPSCREGSRGMIFVIHLKDNQKVGVIMSSTLSVSCAYIFSNERFSGSYNLACGSP